ncbi:hypothetical protein [Oceanobacillus sp. CFH 90083]|uniref:hypothetical protein n=1 Tax=Oceanobacillus sp. CFH 90083 TaxID=2592336 RepID=UPI00128AF5C7|nr:hypothetical protein [Oceanobacillus sp. CFH 90083]
MKTKSESLLLRKLTATFVTTIFFSMLFVFVYFNSGFEFAYHRGSQFISWFLVYALYIGMIILIYGNVVAMTIECLQRKWFRQHDWLYVLILGFFGLVNGVLFQDGMAALYGALAAIIYGIFDKWLYRRKEQEKSVKPFLIIPVVSIVVCWGYLELTSPPVPPFEKEDAVDFATSGEGAVTDEFPNYIGQWEGTMEGYQVTKETAVEEIGDEVFIVTFTKHWKKGDEMGTWTSSYKVDRQSRTLLCMEGDMPSYDTIGY